MIISMNFVSASQAYPLMKKLWVTLKPLLLKKYPLVVEVYAKADKVTQMQRAYYHGYVLLQISIQARVNGNKFALDTWKEYFRKKYLGYEVQTVLDPISGKTYQEEVRVSSESLGVKGYAELIEMVTAEAATELNVKFPVKYSEWVENAESK